MNEIQTTLYPEAQPDTGQSTAEPTWVLSELEVFNWGPFSGLHRAEFDPEGTAIIGPTGSGKTTLVDALMTLLVAQPRYNLASTGGHESDRTLISYVRGVLGGDGTDGRDQVARPGKTITGICATYRAGEESLRLAGLLFTDGSSNAAQDLKRRWIFSQAKDQTLEVWLRLLHEESARELKRVGRETAQLRIFDSKKAYLAHTRKFFDVGDNAFTLLNRAAGLKQLNSIDEIFRELVLDDRAAFDRSLEVAAEFDNLAGIYAELETARRQQASLEPVAAEHKKLEKAHEKLRVLQSVKVILPIWFALIGQKLWANVLSEIEDDRQEKRSVLADNQRKVDALGAHVDTLRQRYLKLGGHAIGDLEKTISVLAQSVAGRQKNAHDYLQLIRKFQLDETLSRIVLQKNQSVLKAKHETIRPLHDQAEKETLDARSEQREAEKQAAEVEDQLQKVNERPGSNIPPRFQDFRIDLASELSISEDELPFLAELIEVKPEEAAWRGAIERAIGSERLQILVPEDQLRTALHWVNHRNNRLHVRLQSASGKASPRVFFGDGFTRKLNFKTHWMIETAKGLLAQRDRHCVASPEALQTVEYGMTIEGMMSARNGKFEKQDQRRLNDGWMTGFDNKDQLESLRRQRNELGDSIKQLKANCDVCFSKQKELEHQLWAIDSLAGLEFSEIDLPGAQAELAASERRLEALLDPGSDASQAKSDYDSETAKLETVNRTINQLNNEIARLDERTSQAERKLGKTLGRIGKGLDRVQIALAEGQLAVPSGTDADDLDSVERDAAAKSDEKLEGQHDRVVVHETRLVRLMEKAKREDTGALVDVGSELEDIPAYLAQLHVLNDEALPAKRKRFLTYLNESSDQGVTQLLAGIQEEVDLIEHRIADLNLTLLKVDFRSGRYLQLRPQRIKHERLRSLESAMRRLRNAALADDEGTSHYKALREVVAILRDAGDNRRQQGSRALLDPRYRLEFYVVEIDRVIPLQVVRGFAWTLICLAMMSVSTSRRWALAISIGLVLAIVMNSQLLLPNPIMSASIRYAHLLETATSNFLFGAFCVILWTPSQRHPERDSPSAATR